MVLISMIQDLDACTSAAGFFRVGRTNEPTNKAILGVGFGFLLIVYFHYRVFVFLHIVHLCISNY